MLQVQDSAWFPCLVQGEDSGQGPVHGVPGDVTSEVFITLPGPVPLSF